MTIASGLIGPRVHKRTAIDLVKLEASRANLIELKWGSDCPMAAAFQILRYALVYLFSRDMRHDFGYEDKAIMHVQRIGLAVLAPQEYYRNGNFGFVATGIQDGLKALCDSRSDGLEMTFQFLSFPPDFELTYKTGADVHRYADDPLSSTLLASPVLDEAHP